MTHPHGEYGAKLPIAAKAFELAFDGSRAAVLIQKPQVKTFFSWVPR
jgi:hypothetical protein